MREAGEDASHADVIERFIELIDDACQDELADRLWAEHGLTPAQLVEIASSVRNSDPEAWRTNADQQRRPTSPEARSAIRNLFLRNVPADRIADVLDLDVALVEGYIAGQGMNDRSREVLQDHRDGFTPAEIAKRRAVPRSTCTKIIIDAGEQPHRRYRASSDATRAAIIQMRQLGSDYGEIRDALGVDTTIVRNTLHLAKKRGLL